jgi:hypothetical protein
MDYNFTEENSHIIYTDRIMYKKVHIKRQSLRKKFTNEELDEGFIVNFPFAHTYRSFASEAVNIPLCRFFRRSGVIPYTIVNGEKFYCLGVDSKYGTLTDFGGSTRRYETFAGAAVRELEEESLGIFNFSPIIMYQNSYAVYDDHNIILFVYVKITSMEDTVKLFNKKFSNATESENCGIIWIPENIFFELIRSGKSIRHDKYIYSSVYKPVADLLRSVSCNNDIV